MDTKREGKGGNRLGLLLLPTALTWKASDIPPTKQKLIFWITQSWIVYSCSPLCPYQLLYFIIHWKIRMFCIQNNGEERRSPWDVSHLTKAFEKELKAGRLLDLMSAFKCTLHKNKLYFFLILQLSPNIGNSKST